MPMSYHYGDIVLISVGDPPRKQYVMITSYGNMSVDNSFLRNVLIGTYLANPNKGLCFMADQVIRLADQPEDLALISVLTLGRSRSPSF